VKKVEKDLMKVRKGSEIKIKDGRVGVASGLYLSATGPVFMVKTRDGQITAENVPAEDIDGLLVEE
jgi:hypothetical protein